MIVLHCVGCRDEREFEQPPCVDGHDDCPELACIECGLAVTLPWIDELAAEVLEIAPRSAVA